MADKETGGPAFPVIELAFSSREPGTLSIDKVAMPGMSLRDWFAGMALQGYLAMHADTETDAPKPERAAKSAYAIADAMLKAREE